MADWRDRVIRFLTPWYDERKVHEREQRTEVIRLKSIGARVHTEQVIDRFRRTDELLRQ